MKPIYKQIQLCNMNNKLGYWTKEQSLNKQNMLSEQPDTNLHKKSKIIQSKFRVNASVQRGLD